jgi:hypothetical protein
MKPSLKSRKNRFTLCFFEVELATLIYFLSPVFADGRSMDQAANSVVSIALSVAKAVSVLGLLAAGIAYNIPGLEDKARACLKGSFMGAVCTFGGPAFVRMIQNIF